MMLRLCAIGYVEFLGVICWGIFLKCVVCTTICLGMKKYNYMREQDMGLHGNYDALYDIPELKVRTTLRLPQFSYQTIS